MRGGVRHGRRIVAVDVQQPRAGNLLVGDLGGVDAQAIAALPQHGALAGGVVDDDIGRLVGAVAAKLHVIQVDPRALQAVPLDAAAIVVADRTDVLGFQAELGAGHQRGGHLPARADHLFLKRHLARVGGKARHYQQGIGGIETDADHVEFGHERTIVRERTGDPRGLPAGYLPRTSPEIRTFRKLPVSSNDPRPTSP